MVTSAAVIAIGDAPPPRRPRQSKLLVARTVVSWRYATDLPAAGNEPPVVRWRKLMLGPDGPTSPTTRLVLLALATHMDNLGGSCFPSLDLLAKESRLSKRVVIFHMNLAHDECWFERTEHTGYAKGWRRYEYQATGPTFERGYSASPR